VKILVLSVYYEPELSAGSFRTTALVRDLARQLPAGAQVEVITSLPNRFGSYRVDVPTHEQQGPVTVRRIALPAHSTGMLGESIAFVALVRQALRLVRHEDYALVYATSAKLGTAVLGSWIARRKHALLYLDIRDIFVDNVKEMLPRMVRLVFTPLASQLERFALRRATKVNLVSDGFASYFRRRYPTQEFSFFTNGIDEEFIGSGDATPASPQDDGAATDDAGAARVLTVVYAGNMGGGQGLHLIIPELARRLQGRVRFRLIGDGGGRRALESRLAAEGVDNVAVLPPVNRKGLIEEYRAADVLFLHLNDHDAFRKVLPSKIFEYAATGKPIWAGVAGYAADFLREHVDNAAIFAPCDALGATEAFARLNLSCTPRTEFVNRFSRRSISTAMAADIISILDRNS
jgi:glycosyltransferase involved in cell wall biosynthesis